LKKENRKSLGERTSRDWTGTHGEAASDSWFEFVLLSLLGTWIGKQGVRTQTGADRERTESESKVQEPGTA
jgi:hypothetical protein